MIEKLQFQNCLSNNFAISCFKNYGLVSTWDACNQKCVQFKFLKIFQFRPFWLTDYYNFGLQLNKTNFLSNKEVSENPSRENFDNINFCTNLKYNFENSKWTDIDNEKTFIAMWSEKFGDFWDNYQGGYPVQPEEPVTASHSNFPFFFQKAT